MCILPEPHIEERPPAQQDTGHNAAHFHPYAERQKQADNCAHLHTHRAQKATPWLLLSLITTSTSSRMSYLGRLTTESAECMLKSRSSVSYTVDVNELKLCFSS